MFNNCSENNLESLARYDFFPTINFLLADLDNCNLIVCSLSLNILKHKILFNKNIHLSKIYNLSYYNNFTNIVIDKIYIKIFVESEEEEIYEFKQIINFRKKTIPYSTRRLTINSFSEKKIQQKIIRDHIMIRDTNLITHLETIFNQPILEKCIPFYVVAIVPFFF